MNNTVLIIIGMAVVTYIPRLLPLVIRRNTQPPEWMKRTLQLLPFTAIGALLVPDAFTAVGGNVAVAAIGLAVAAVTTWLTKQPFLAVIAAVLAVAGAQTIL